MFERAHGRFLATLTIVGLMLALYSLINGRFESTFDFAIGLDHAIPLLPWTLPIYASLYVLALLGSLLVERHTFERGLRALVLVALVSFLGFVTLPAAYPRPDVSDLDSMWRPALQWYYAHDPPTNTFPSLHVATAAVMGWMLRSVGRWQIWATWATLIMLSTLTTKQHFVADVIGGAVVAAVALAAVEYHARRTRPS